jgi:hypothetical protein
LGSTANRSRSSYVQLVWREMAKHLIFVVRLMDARMGGCFVLVIYDRPTHYVLWALTESIAPAEKQKTHDHNFDEALATLVLDAGRLTKSLPSGMH